MTLSQTTPKLIKNRRKVPRSVVLGCLAAVCGACAPAKQPVQLQFRVTYDGQTLSCSTTPTGLADFRAYLSEIHLIRDDGKAEALALTPDSHWQNHNVVLLDLEDGEGACVNGTAETNDRIVGEIPAGTYTGVEFTVGVPFTLNHQNPITAAAPLDDSAMHWHWRSGYKFMRAAIDVDGQTSVFHLGSTGCTGVVGAIERCHAPNRVTVRLDNFALDKAVVSVDLARLFEESGSSPGHCLSEPGESACIGPFAALGLGIDEPGSAAPSQRVFVVRQ